MVQIEKIKNNLEKKYNMKIYVISNMRSPKPDSKEAYWINIETEINNINQLNNFLKDIMRTGIFTSKKFHTISIVLKEGYDYEVSKVLYNGFYKTQVIEDITKPFKYSLVFK